MYRDQYRMPIGRLMPTIREFFGLIFVLVPGLAIGNTLPPVIANVTDTGTYDIGAVYVFFDRPISSCSGSNRIDLGANHSARANVLSIAMTALTSGKTVVIHPGSCNGIYPTFDEVGDSYFYLTTRKP